MGREVRRVPAHWHHPAEHGQYKPLRQLEMPIWPDEKRTHLQMYETTSEGTPISPVMETPEALAQWLVDHRASAFAGQTASYEAWLMVCEGRTAISGVVTKTAVLNGIEYEHKFGPDKDVFDHIDKTKRNNKSRGQEIE